MRTAILILVLSGALPAQQPSGNGDLNCDGTAGDISDLVYLASFMFQGGPAPCEYITPIFEYDTTANGGAIPTHDTWFTFDTVSMDVPCPGLLHVEAQIQISSYSQSDFGFPFGWDTDEIGQPIQQYTADIDPSSDEFVSLHLFVEADTAGYYRYLLRGYRGDNPVVLMNLVTICRFYPADSE